LFDKPFHCIDDWHRPPAFYPASTLARSSTVAPDYTEQQKPGDLTREQFPRLFPAMMTPLPDTFNT